MSTRGKTIKYESPEALKLLRPMITRRFELVADHETCCGCGTCATVCPQEAITMSEPAVVGGRLVDRPRVDIDPATCNFCGECVVLCPTHSLSMTVNGQPEVPVVKGDAFPTLIRKVAINQEVLGFSTDVAYIDNCPMGAISADVQRNAEERVVSLSGVAIDQGCASTARTAWRRAPRAALPSPSPTGGGPS